MNVGSVDSVTVFPLLSVVWAVSPSPSSDPVSPDPVSPYDPLSPTDFVA